MTDLRERVARAICEAREELEAPEVLDSAYYRMADAAIAETGKVRVNPLVWVDTSQSFLGERYSAQTIFGVEYVILWDDRAMTWSGFIWGQWTDYGDEGGFQKAKAAAQADYERRIRSALTPADAQAALEKVKREARNEGRREAVMNLRAYAPHLVDGPEYDIGYHHGYQTALNRILALMEDQSDD